MGVRLRDLGAGGVRTASVRLYSTLTSLGWASCSPLVRSYVTYPGDPGGALHKSRRPPCPITTPHTRDLDWIPVVARAGWVAITRDHHIQDHRGQVPAVRGHSLRLVALSAPGARTTWEQLEVLMCQWRAIGALVDKEGPLLSVATRRRSDRSPWRRPPTDHVPYRPALVRVNPCRQNPLQSRGGR